MKKIIITILLFSVLVSIFSLTKITRGYDNLPTICFDGKQKEILFINDNKGDLFNNLKELMPGDKKQQDIILKLENIKFDTKEILDVKWLDIEKVKNMTNRELRGYDTAIQVIKDFEDKKIYPLDVFHDKKYKL